ncbi:hypothetical protein [Saccharibacter floricola]|uniref:Uncharacterized protein n=1 Tax=Saccharibacter floricola DSM 15669 TaxID=1123227 RepID=A0ABQ0P0G8_9PROT|nr:hypothetical protein [Saccharibacter floricola]GBQ08048.1 hypothetical protein AA15669_1636 [Saccharibacter floricola DSM 15669]
MTDFSFQRETLPDLTPWQGMLSRKEVLEFSRALYPGDVGPEDVLEAACLIDAWQRGNVAFSIEKARDENVPEGEETPGYCSLSDLRVLVSIKDDAPLPECPGGHEGKQELLDNSVAEKDGEIAILKGTVSDLKWRLYVKHDKALSLEGQLHQEKTALAEAQQALKKRTILAVCFAGVAAIEAASCLVWAYL